MQEFVDRIRPRLAEVSLSNHRHGAAVDFTDLQRGHLWLSEFIICTICTMFRYVYWNELVTSIYAERERDILNI